MKEPVNRADYAAFGVFGADRYGGTEVHGFAMVDKHNMAP